MQHCWTKSTELLFNGTTTSDTILRIHFRNAGTVAWKTRRQTWAANVLTNPLKAASATRTEAMAMSAVKPRNLVSSRMQETVFGLKCERTSFFTGTISLLRFVTLSILWLSIGTTRVEFLADKVHAWVNAVMESLSFVVRVRGGELSSRVSAWKVHLAWTDARCIARNTPPGWPRWMNACTAAREKEMICWLSFMLEMICSSRENNIFCDGKGSNWVAINDKILSKVVKPKRPGVLLIKYQRSNHLNRETVLNKFDHLNQRPMPFELGNCVFHFMR